MTPKVGISSCLLGNAVRFDGAHKRERFLTDVLSQFVDWVPVCPEVEAGMGVPREPVRLIGSASAPKMIAEKTGRDWTPTMNQFCARRVEKLLTEELSGYIFKKDSPSCGMERVRVYGRSGQPARTGRGLFAAALMRELPLLPVEEEGRLRDPALREHFIVRLFAYRRWQDALAARRSVRALVEFHTRHKLLLLAHSERHERLLGPLVANAKRKSIAQLYAEYGELFMAALTIRATRKTHTNILQHMQGYISSELTPAERRELVALIHDYRCGELPLIVPITLLRHYVDKFDVQYLKMQAYLEPSPKALMLRNHV